MSSTTPEIVVRPSHLTNVQSLPSLGAFDVIVAGGGAAGSAAAIVAGRLGLSVLLIEPLSFLGGTGVGAQVTPWMGNGVNLGQLNEGLTAEIQRDLEAAGQAAGYFVNPEAIKLLLERKAIDAGATLLFESQVIGVTGRPRGEDLQLTGVVIATRQGLRRASARFIIDATGDANIAHMAGAPCREGREADGVHQPMSLRFVLGGIDIPRFKDFLRKLGPYALGSEHGEGFANGPCKDAFLAFARKDAWPADWINTFTIQFFGIPGRPGELWFNCPRIAGFDPLDPLSLSRAYVEGRRKIEAYLRLFRNHVAGAEKVFLAQVAPLMGVRESRRVVGPYVLTGDDFLQRRKFDDGICLNRYPIDVHNPHGQGLAEWVEMPEGDWHEIPYRCLIPLKLRSTLVAGRCVSSDFSAQASYRIIPNCRTMGEAAAVACAMAKADEKDVSEIDGRAVRKRMFEMNLLPKWAKRDVDA